MQQVKPQQLQKWEITVRSSKLQGVKPDQAWSLVSDYYGIHKILPSITSASEKVDGGLRQITFSMNGSPQTHWFKDRLVNMDHKVRSYTYEIGENDCGLEKITSTLKVGSSRRA
ncbi:lachrymatory-factor synthase [Iris pallida]|uniref:Lachrymatory-factor synthase n=1 Tax=Iris pallida TaxID=29817 RepID=A0AAX6FYR1_IRIPA|nr:lachrymatory-factor synthase [Iris pallida]